MLDATIYAQAVNLAIENARAAITRGDDDQAQQHLERFTHILSYCAVQGLMLDTSNSTGELSLRRDRMNPYGLNILINGETGWSYRTLPNRRALREQPPYEPTYEMDHFWEERRAIERDDVELPPWGTWKPTRYSWERGGAPMFTHGRSIETFVYRNNLKGSIPPCQTMITF